MGPGSILYNEQGKAGHVGQLFSSKWYYLEYAIGLEIFNQCTHTGNTCVDGNY
jgi:hypothetical protein